MKLICNLDIWWVENLRLMGVIILNLFRSSADAAFQFVSEHTAVDSSIYDKINMHAQVRHGHERLLDKTFVAAVCSSHLCIRRICVFVN